MGWIIVLALAAAALWAVSAYNALVRKRIIVSEAWSGIDAQLKRRTELVPNLVETVKGYASHERDALEDVTRLRTAGAGAGSIAERAELEKQFAGAIGRLMAVAEAYPDLKASANFQALQGELATIENDIQFARRFYNGAVRDYNIAIEQAPSNLVASAFAFQQAPFFELDSEDERAVPQVKFGA